MTPKLALISILFMLTLSGYSQCPDRVVYWRKLQNIYTLSSDKQIATYIKLKAIGEKCKLDNDSTYSNVLFGLAEMYYYSSSFKEAIHNTELAIFTTLNNPQKSNLEYFPKFYFYLGLFYYSDNDYQKAIDAFNNAKKYCLKFNRSSEYLISSSQYLSDIYFNLGDYEKSIYLANEGLLSVDLLTFNKENYKFRLIYQKAKSYYELKEFHLALESINEGILSIRKYNNTVDLGYALFLKGNILSLQRNNYNEAEKSFLQSISIFENSKDTLNLAIAYTNTGNFYTKVGLINKSIEYSLLAFRLTKSKEGKARILNNVGYAYRLKKDYLASLKNFQKAFSYLSLNFKNEKIEENPSLQIVKYLDYKEFFLSLLQDKAICWLDYAKASNNNKNYLKYALQTYEVADKLIDYMRYEHTGTQSKYFWRNKTRSTYESAIETCYLLKDYEKAFYFFEKSRSVLLNDKLNELGAKQKLSEEDLQKEKDFQKQIADLNVSIEKTQNAKQKGDLNNKIIDLQEQQDRFIKTLETKNPAYYQIKYDATSYNLSQIQNYLRDSGGSLVEYFVGDSATYSIVISPNTVSLKKLNFNVNNTQLFVNLCSKKITTKTELSTFLTLGSEVYKSLIMPLNLQKGHLIISQDGVFLPFEALSKSVNKPDYLLNDFMISYTYSAQFLLRNKSKNFFLPNNKFIGIAPINFTQKLNPLNGSDKSIDNIAKSYFWSNQLIGKEGSKKAFLNNAKNYKIVQIYTHAFADSNETEPRIYFADSALKVSDLSMEDQFKTNLLVLSACKTGVGRVAKGEGVLSLARGFSMAGIPSTITSLWSIEDRDTYSLTELFYKFLKEGLPKDEALQKAKIEFITSSENAMPNAWAGMVLIGDNSPLEKHNSLVFWILGGLALGGIGFYFKQKKPTKAGFLKF